MINDLFAVFKSYVLKRSLKLFTSKFICMHQKSIKGEREMRNHTEKEKS